MPVAQPHYPQLSHQEWYETTSPPLSYFILIVGEKKCISKYLSNMTYWSVFVCEVVFNIKASNLHNRIISLNVTDIIVLKHYTNAIFSCLRTR